MKSRRRYAARRCRCPARCSNLRCFKLCPMNFICSRAATTSRWMAGHGSGRQPPYRSNLFGARRGQPVLPAYFGSLSDLVGSEGDLRGVARLCRRPGLLERHLPRREWAITGPRSSSPKTTVPPRRCRSRWTGPSGQAKELRRCVSVGTGADCGVRPAGARYSAMADEVALDFPVSRRSPRSRRRFLGCSPASFAGGEDPAG